MLEVCFFSEILCLRIIAGTCRSRTFEAPEGLTTRPTLDRVREAFFGSIQFEVEGARVLDLFSGSGGISLEAASRGAGLCVACDHDPKCESLIRKNAEKLGLSEKLRVLNMDYQEALSLLGREGFKADIVYLDAPYASGFSLLAAETIFRLGLLGEDGRLFIEHSGDVEIPSDAPFEERRTKQYGKCFVTELRRKEA